MNRQHQSDGPKRWAMLLVAIALTASPVAADECDASADDCLRGMHDSIAKRGWLGIEYEEESESGLPEIVKVMEASPAAKGGLRAGDRLLSINGVSYASSRETIYAEVRKALVPGNEIALVVERDGEDVALTVVAGHVPDTIAAQWIGRHLMEFHLGDDVDEHDDESEDES